MKLISKKCGNCNLCFTTEIAEQARFCPKCGSPFDGSSEPSNELLKQAAELKSSNNRHEARSKGLIDLALFLVVGFFLLLIMIGIGLTGNMLVLGIAALISLAILVFLAVSL